MIVGIKMWLSSSTTTSTTNGAQLLEWQLGTSYQRAKFMAPKCKCRCGDGSRPPKLLDVFKTTFWQPVKRNGKSKAPKAKLFFIKNSFVPIQIGCRPYSATVLRFPLIKAKCPFLTSFVLRLILLKTVIVLSWAALLWLFFNISIFFWVSLHWHKLGERFYGKDLRQQESNLGPQRQKETTRPQRRLPFLTC